jgi:hypothetical protein
LTKNFKIWRFFEQNVIRSENESILNSSEPWTLIDKKYYPNYIRKANSKSRKNNLIQEFAIVCEKFWRMTLDPVLPFKIERT